MAIKTDSQGIIPAIDLNYLQYSEFNMRVSEDAPYNIAISGKVRPYGTDTNGVKYFAKDPLKPLSIPNLDAFITSLPPADQVDAIQALGMVQTGLGKLAKYFYGINFVGVE